MAAVLLYNENVRRQRVFRPRLDSLDELDDEDVVSRYRLTKDMILTIEEMCRDDLAPHTHRSCAISSLTKVLTGLRFLAKGDFFSEVGDLHGISRASMHHAVEEFVNSINNRLHNIRFPTNRDVLNESKRVFFQRSRLPNVIGAVDGTLIPIQAPHIDEPAYVCRKGYHAINVQAVCDHERRFTDVVAMWPGSQHDSAIFNSCTLKNYLEDHQVGMLLGDSGYGLKRYLLTPKPRPTTHQEHTFNLFHSRGRIVIERAFGLLKSRFRCLHKTGGALMFEPGKCCKIATCCMRLHNMCLDRGLPEPHELLDDDDQDDHEEDYHNNNNNNNNIRQELINLF